MSAGEGSISSSRCRRGPKSKSRRNWNSDEEDVLLTCLTELVATGWKSDNGFRPGYINFLEQAMRIKFPRANIKATPHIVSKITGWKKNYGSLLYILSRSGVGFNVHGDFTVDCDDETWDHICNVDSNAANIRGKSWPLFDRWAEVFGKDRATGESAKDVMEAVNELIIEDNLNGVKHVDADASINMGDTNLLDEAENSVSNTTKRDAGCARIPKKRKAIDEADKQLLCHLLGQMQRDTNVRLECISTKIGYAADLGKTRKEIFNLLEEVPDMSLDARFDICDILVDNPKRMEFFIGLPEVARPAYAHRLLHGKGL